MRVLITRSFCLRPGLDVGPGDVVDVTRYEYACLMKLDRAIDVPDDQEPAPLSATSDTDQPLSQPTAKRAPAKPWGRK